MKVRAMMVVGLWSIAAAAYGQNDDTRISSDRPGATDSSEVIGPGRWQIETGLRREVGQAGEEPERKLAVPTLLRLGLNEKWEARLESDVHAWMRDSDGTRTQAYAPFYVGFKYRVMEAAGPVPSLAAIARVAPPSGSKTLRTGQTTGDLRLAADWELSERWSLNPNIGWAIDEDDDGQRFSAALLAVTLEYKLSRALEFFVDAAAKRPEATGAGSAVLYGVGLAYLVSRDLQVDLTVGVRGAGSTVPRSLVAAGFSMRF